MRRLVCALVLAAGPALAAPAALAHSVGARIEAQPGAVVIAFAYGGGDPIAFGEVTVTAPDGRIHQKGRSDRAGRFAVAVPPGTPGDWTVAIDDGQGHSSTLRFAAGAADRVALVQQRVAQGLGLVSLALLLATFGLGAALIRRRTAG